MNNVSGREERGEQVCAVIESSTQVNTGWCEAQTGPVSFHPIYSDPSAGPGFIRVQAGGEEEERA